MQQKKSRRWVIVTYATPKEFQQLLDEAIEWAYIYHDKDEKEPHYHIYLRFENPRWFEGLKKLINSEQNTLGQPAKSTKQNIIKYFTHENEPQKHKYKNEDIERNDNFEITLKELQQEKNEEFIEDLMNGLTLKEMGIKYGRDFMKNYKKYYEFAQDVKKEELYKTNYGENAIAVIEFDYEITKAKINAYRTIEIINTK